MTMTISITQKMTIQTKTAVRRRMNLQKKKKRKTQQKTDLQYIDRQILSIELLVELAFFVSQLCLQAC